VIGIDDLTTLASMAGHPQAAKLRMTSNLPRSPGVYLFCGHRDEVLYVGKATNLRQRVRSYFGQEDRRKIGPMLRETQSVRHHCLPDPLSAEVVEARLISRLKPRYNRAGTRADRYCYIRLDVDTPWPRLAIVKDAARTGLHLGPLPSRTMATLVVEALQSALPLRRCSTRLGRTYVAPPGATPCAAAQMGVAACPCAGAADRRVYDDAVAVAAEAMGGAPGRVVERLADRMRALATAQRFEEAAMARDRLSALEGAIKRTGQMDGLLARGRFEATRGDVTWVIDRARLVDVRVAGSTAGALPASPPAAPEPGRPLPRALADEALVLARRLPIDAGTSGPVGDGGTAPGDRQELRMAVDGQRRGDGLGVALAGEERDGGPAAGQPAAPRAGLEATRQGVPRPR
jgi:DNA polymerase-3 subunit epsilon